MLCLIHLQEKTRVKQIDHCLVNERHGVLINAVNLWKYLEKRSKPEATQGENPSRGAIALNDIKDQIIYYFGNDTDE